ncbi:LOW QUALITY PROTEIN: regulatory protein, partial [Streptomyces sp. C]
MGVAVRKRRRALHLTLAAVSARSGLSVPFLSQIENERARPSMRSLERVADALETTAVDLLAASDTARTVDLVRAGEESGFTPVMGVRPLVRGHHQLHALEFTGDQDAGREYQHRNDELMYVVSGACQMRDRGAGVPAKERKRAVPLRRGAPPLARGHRGHPAAGRRGRRPHPRHLRAALAGAL